MHILIVAPEQIPVPGSGSVEISILSIAKQLAKYHKVTIVSRQSRMLHKISRNANLTIVRVPSGRGGRYISSVLRFMKGKHFDCIQVDNRPSYMAVIKRRFPHIPVSLFLHSLTFVPRTQAITECLAKADLIIANSISLKNNLCRMFPIQKNKIRIVYLGVDVARFKPPSIAQKNEMKRKYRLSQSFSILFTGRVIARKGVPVVIRAVSLVRKTGLRTKLMIVGKGKPSYIRQLKQQAADLGVPAVFIGKISHAQIHRFYRSADCFVCPSQRHEAFGLVNVEAMASGVPVVASNIGGIREIVKHGTNGYLVDQYHNPVRFAHYLRRIALHPKLAERLGSQGRKTALHRFSWTRTALELASIYKSIQR